MVCFLFGLFLLFGCKKYPEDKSLVHFRTAKRRLISGRPWNIVAYKVNGEDSLQYLNSYYSSYKPVEEIDLKVLSSSLSDNNKKLKWGWAHVGRYGIESYVWEIKRLDKNILWIEQMGLNNVVYRLELKGAN